MSSVPPGFRRLQGSERRPSPSAKALGIANPNESFAVTIVLRRRLDGAPLPDHDFFLNTPPSQRQRMSSSEFAVLYGASNEDIDKVIKFVTAHHLTVIDAHAARRTVSVSGTVQQMESFFATRLGRFEHQIVRGATDRPTLETYRGLDGFIHIPEDLEGIIVGVFGLDDRTVTKRNRSDDDDSSDTFPTLSVPKLTSSDIYDFPDQSASGQTIAIFSESGYLPADIKTYFDGLGLAVPTVQDINIDDAKNTVDWDTSPETTMDICIAGSAAPGASVAVYFTPGKEKGWVDLIGRVAHPKPGDPVCSVLSSSYYHYDGDDKAKKHFTNAVSSAFQDAALQGVTVCVASGDHGSYSNIDDNKVHVQYPASDPWVLTVGGTTIANKSPPYAEYVWNHEKDATGGGVSAYFPLPSYQRSATVPVSLNDNKSTGRGVPDVAANADKRNGFKFEFNGDEYTSGGTSASAPLWAGLIARINAAMGENIGYINPALYALGSSVFNDIDGSKGPKDNKVKDYSAPGYPANPGWDACTGWGSPKGNALCDGLNEIFFKRCTIVSQNFQSNVNSTTFIIQVDGFRPADFGIQPGRPITSRVQPDIYFSDPIEVSCVLEKLHVQDITLPPTPQRFTWVYSLTYTSTIDLQVGLISITATVTSLKGEFVIGRGYVLLQVDD